MRRRQNERARDPDLPHTQMRESGRVAQWIGTQTRMVSSLFAQVDEFSGGYWIKSKGRRLASEGAGRLGVTTAL